MGNEKVNLFVVALEPTPYSTDLWNSFTLSGRVDVMVVHVQKKNWAKDGGHNYMSLPLALYDYAVYDGNTVMNNIWITIDVVRRIMRCNPALCFVSGYDRLSTGLVMICLSLMRRRYVLHSDQFNNESPIGKFKSIRYIARSLLRFVAFSFSEAILVCGLKGRESAVMAGCEPRKIINFPYVVDVGRILSDNPGEIIDACKRDLEQGVKIIFFSGRMISRKGLQVLLEAVSGVRQYVDDFVVWIEGDGPDFLVYQNMAHRFNVSEICRFVGFCQYNQHSWLIRTSDIVVVPSYKDAWGIVVDEALQLGKVVISSDSVGSGCDRIIDGQNGFLVSAGDVNALSLLLKRLLTDEPLCQAISSAARDSTLHVTPEDNVGVLLDILN